MNISMTLVTGAAGNIHDGGIDDPFRLTVDWLEEIGIKSPKAARLRSNLCVELGDVSTCPAVPYATFTSTGGLDD